MRYIRTSTRAAGLVLVRIYRIKYLCPWYNYYIYGLYDCALLHFVSVLFFYRSTIVPTLVENSYTSIEGRNFHTVVTDHKPLTFIIPSLSLVSSGDKWKVLKSDSRSWFVWLCNELTKKHNRYFTFQTIIDGVHSTFFHSGYFGYIWFVLLCNSLNIANKDA